MNRKDFISAINDSFHVLGNQTKLQIFLKILQEGCDCDIDSQRGFTGNCVTSIMDELNLPQSTVSSYLKDLQKAGLIECKKNGKFVHCRPKREALVNLKSFIDSSLSQLKY
jgi:predicted transcriptional regulator